MINPHGNKLINRIVSEKVKKDFKQKQTQIKSIQLNRRQLSDLEMLAIGGYSPLEGFMSKEDYESTIYRMKLSNDVVWPLPITLAVDKKTAESFEIGEDIGLLNEEGIKTAILHLQDKYSYDKNIEAEKVYLTKDIQHPGVHYLYSQGDIYLGGKIELIENPTHDEFKRYYFTPAETRNLFEKKLWKTIVGFQTRNPIHRAHEYIQKCALEIFDGLFLHPIIGETKGDDIPADIRMKCYEVLIEKYYPLDRIVLAINPSSMRYAGPREAIFHAIIRKNYGCTHFIVGRDHAGVGNYYGTYDAQKIFSKFIPEEIGITPLFFEHTFYCKKCQAMASSKTCPHTKENLVILSGTSVRKMLQDGIVPPVEFTRPEIAQILIDNLKLTKDKKNQQSI